MRSGQKKRHFAPQTVKPPTGAAKSLMNAGPDLPVSDTGPSLAAIPALACGVRYAAWLPAGGVSTTMPLGEAARLAEETPPLVCHRLTTAQRLRRNDLRCFDLLELFAFARPAMPCVPTPAGLAAALGLPKPARLADEPQTLADAAALLLQEIAANRDATLAPLAWQMARGGWTWGPLVLARTGIPSGSLAGRARHAMQAWEGRPVWEERAPEGPPGSDPVDPADARR
ncbi:MAG TPA: hypothetical protein VJ947_01440, partial [Pseudohaliea sp.]|nr:hypothetical protein [Pseudohaliea sp.]